MCDLSIFDGVRDDAKFVQRRWSWLAPNRRGRSTSPGRTGGPRRAEGAKSKKGIKPAKTAGLKVHLTAFALVSFNKCAP